MCPIPKLNPIHKSAVCVCVCMEHTFSHYQRNLIYNTQFMQFCILHSNTVYLSTMNCIHSVHLYIRLCVHGTNICLHAVPFVCVKKFYMPISRAVRLSALFSSSFAHSVNCCLPYYICYYCQFCDFVLLSKQPPYE